MTRPSIFVRLAGHPFVAIVLFALCAAVLFAWWEGGASGWLSFAATLLALRTLAAIRLKRAYKAWRANWDYISGNDAPPTKKSSRGLVILAALFVAMVPLMSDYLRHSVRLNENVSTIVLLLWAASVLFVVFAFVRGIVRSISKRREVAAAVAVVKAKDESVVTLLLGRPSSSPTREDAEHELPDYCYRLNKVGQSRRMLRPSNESPQVA